MSGADLQLLDDSFEELAARTDLPDFDIIALHGIWSWISDANRKTILDIIRRKLRAGGIVYVSYNCLPGWAPAIPVRQLMTLYGDYGGGQMAAPQGAIDGALQFSADVLKAGSRYFRENPAAARHFERLSKQSRNYIAHEYLNTDWHLVHFSDMARSLQEAKLSFVGFARLIDRIDGMHLTEDGRKLLSGIGHPVLRGNGPGLPGQPAIPMRCVCQRPQVHYPGSGSVKHGTHSSSSSRDAQRTFQRKSRAL